MTFIFIMIININILILLNTNLVCLVMLGYNPVTDWVLPGGEDSLPFNILVSVYLLAYLIILIVVPNRNLKNFLNFLKK